MEPCKIAKFVTRTKEYLRSFLRTRGVPSDGSESQKDLAERCFWAEKLGLERRHTDDEAAEEIASSKCNKLILDGGLIKLPRPETLAEWESSLSSLPDLTRSRMETYITSVGRKLGSKGSKTLGLGKGLYLSNHVTDVEFHGVSPNINYCFVRAKMLNHQLA
ncbi:hypothetical protein HOLleu_31581 [Holothuria leucospilota]|uniref:Uncharacterized protein n=1 Tax=Holothuria leucospilota TaxID=206669 RepID=A0A9Q1BHD7_HOLLE|nr:hypothetical protein HOLleu_31581 [Holothuria leucospilota]